MENELYLDDELDSEWEAYIAALHQKSKEIDKQNQLRETEHQTMINLQKHVRGLSRARFELEDAAVDSFDDSSSEAASHHNTLHDSDDNHLSSDSSDDDIIAPTPAQSDHCHTPQTSQQTQTNTHINSKLLSLPRTSFSLANIKDLNSSDDDDDGDDEHKRHVLEDIDDEEMMDKPDTKPTINRCAKSNTSQSSSESAYTDSKLQEIKSMHDCQESDSADNEHVINYSNDSHDTNDHDLNASSTSSSDTDDINDHIMSSKSSPTMSPSVTPSKSPTVSCTTSESMDDDGMEDAFEDIKYDQELEALTKELNQFKRRNFHHLRQTQSPEAILLSVLNIDQKDIDAQQLESCTKEAIDKYNTMNKRNERQTRRKKSQTDLLQYVSTLDPKDRLFEFPPSPVVMTPIPESPMPSFHDLESDHDISVHYKHHRQHERHDQHHKKRKSLKKKRKKRNRRNLADPYNEEWNGLDPDDYVWYDDVPEGECYDDRELSLRNRRIQYLVVMAIENNYCSISDLTYKQNELLLLYQQSLNF